MLSGTSFAATGMAVLKGTQENSTITGEAILTEVEEGLNVEIVIEGVTQSGKHGIHIHEFGNCENNCKAAGAHYNPEGVLHGLLTRDGHENAHIGDLGNMVISLDGKGILKVFLPGISLSKGRYPVAGRAFVLKTKEDDFSQPSGNAGEPIACGVIIITDE